VRCSNKWARLTRSPRRGRAARWNGESERLGGREVDDQGATALPMLNSPSAFVRTNKRCGCKIPTKRDGDHSPDDRYALLKGMRGRFSNLEAHMRTHASFAIAALIICSVTILWTKNNTDADVIRPRLTFAVVHLKPALQVNPVY